MNLRRRKAPPVPSPPALEAELARVRGLVQAAEAKVDALIERLKAELAAREPKGDVKP